MWTIIASVFSALASLLGIGQAAAQAKQQAQDQSTGAQLQAGADAKKVADVEQAELAAVVADDSSDSAGKLSAGTF